jgi:hypothetical protein
MPLNGQRATLKGVQTHSLETFPASAGAERLPEFTGGDPELSLARD